MTKITRSMVSQRKSPPLLVLMKKKAVFFKKNKRTNFKQRYNKFLLVESVPRSLGSLLLKMRVKPSAIKSPHFIIKCINRINTTSLQHL